MSRDDIWSTFILLVLVVDVIVILIAAYALVHGGPPDLIGPFV